MRTAPDTVDGSWVYRAFVAGCVATGLAGVTVVLGYALSFSLATIFPGVLGRWFAALVANPATRAVGDRLAGALLVHFAVGLFFAVAYAALAEPRLAGPGWRRGAVFALAPWLLSLVVSLPLFGAGFLGLEVGAGPLPILGSLAAHLVYGATLGTVYAVDLAELRRSDPATLAANLGAERGIALGVVCGAVVGALVGLALPLLDGDSRSAALSLASGVLAGAVVGCTVGSFVGLGAGGGRPDVS